MKTAENRPLQRPSRPARLWFDLALLHFLQAGDEFLCQALFRL
jgi:hypothetical protein